MVVRDEWAISCRDLAGRRREVTVLVSSDRVVLIAPPGEAAVLTPLDVGRLRAALRDAVVSVGATASGEDAEEGDDGEFGPA
ncbi:hypothetical protein SacmaDRAFT_1796 [Saccharomonospora marina XMU15]|uniref:Uncharacterized protein n=1 Tax=Saccharomonospora marina XMU15 TaxID=882083 RepID=H5X5J3_9PSEU|nr:hypothetical protein [Saccharomonospora marina]EHR50065.1 hypothetical protein SacmaDRAFT_1796 [Saccharomonospora marina XMU15]